MTGSLAKGNAGPIGRNVATLIAIACGLILVRSAVFHLGNPFGFLTTIYTYDLVASEVGVAVALALPAFQLVLGLLLVLVEEHRPIGLLAASILFASFTAIQVTTLYRGLNISCGCFGPSVEDSQIGTGSIAIAVCCSIFAFTGNRILAHVSKQAT